MITTPRLVAYVVVASALAPSVLHAQGARLTVTPDRPLPGAIVQLVLTGIVETGDAVAGVRGAMGGEPLHFIVRPDGYRAIGAVPVDATASVAAHAIISRASGRADTLRASVEPPPLPPPSEQLAVAPRFSRPLDAATAARVARESARALAVGQRAHDAPARWTEPFVEPRTSAISSGFGTGRMFNGRVASRHLGVDFRGAVGAPIRAANRGVVALVDRFFLGGRVVYLDHGGGLVTGYLHLSEAQVAVGDTVERGETIGLVGATGRVTGPHLHWMARYGTLTVNPLDLLRLEP